MDRRFYFAAEFEQDVTLGDGGDTRSRLLVVEEIDGKDKPGEPRSYGLSLSPPGHETGRQLEASRRLDLLLRLSSLAGAMRGPLHSQPNSIDFARVFEGPNEIGSFVTQIGFDLLELIRKKGPTGKYNDIAISNNPVDDDLFTARLYPSSVV